MLSAAQGVGSSAESPKTRRTFKLSENLKEGTLHTELQELFKKMRKPVKERIQIDDNLAGALTHYYAYTKTRNAINEISRQYTGIKSVPELHVQALNDEIKFMESRRQVEEGFFWASKDVITAIMAITPTLALVLSRGKDDGQLDEQARPMLDTVRVLVHTHVQLTVDHVSNVQKVVNTPLGHQVIKKRTDKYGTMSRAPASRAGRLRNPKITGSSPDPADSISG